MWRKKWEKTCKGLQNFFFLYLVYSNEDCLPYWVADSLWILTWLHYDGMDYPCTFNEDAGDGSMLLWRSRKIYTISIASLKMIQSMVVTHSLCSHSVRQQITKNKQRITCRVFYILFGNWYRAKTCHNFFCLVYADIDLSLNLNSHCAFICFVFFYKFVFFQIFK